MAYPPETGLLDSPEALAVDSSGNIYFSDHGNDRICKFNIQTQILTNIVGPGNYSNLGDGGQATSAYVGWPRSIALDISGNIYIADEALNRIRKVDAETKIITTIAGTGSQGYSGDGGLATNAQLKYPSGVAVDGSGNVYIADAYNAVVRMIDAQTKIITTVAGISTDVGMGQGSYSGDGGLATNAHMYLPGYISLDKYGNLYITDWAYHVIRKVDAITKIITTIAGTGSGGFSGDGGLATSAELYGPYGISVDLSGNVYFAELGNKRIRKISSGVSMGWGVSGNIRGPAGYTGATGIAGIAGSTGSTGATGIAGYTGATGIAGIAGSTGSTGFTGIAGSTGVTGIAGIAGSTGATGFTGIAGSTGFTGAPGAVTSIVAGTNVTISPSNGIGAVTINASGSGGSSIKTALIRFSFLSASTIASNSADSLGNSSMFTTITNTTANPPVITLTLAAPYYASNSSTGRTIPVLYFGNIMWNAGGKLKVVGIPSIATSGTGPLVTMSGNNIVLSSLTLASMANVTDTTSILYNTGNSTGYSFAIYIAFLN
jgi:hypothetical protein